MAADKHVWCGVEKPAHLNNIKEWQLTCGDLIERTLMSAVKDTYRMTYGMGPSSTVISEDLWPIVKEVAPVLIEKMRDNDIPVWNPEADSYEF